MTRNEEFGVEKYIDFLIEHGIMQPRGTLLSGKGGAG
jgi:hypothetical protein